MFVKGWCYYVVVEDEDKSIEEVAHACERHAKKQRQFETTLVRKNSEKRRSDHLCKIVGQNDVASEVVVRNACG